MKKLFGSFYIFILLFVEHTYSQTDSVFSYLPLDIGNRWQYKVHEVVPPLIDSIYYNLYTIEGDTIMSNGYQYKVIKGSDYSTRYVHIDSTTACVYEYESGSTRGFMTDSLRCSEGDGFGLNSHCELIDTATVLNYQTSIMSIARSGPDISEEHTLAMDIGMTYQYNFHSGGVGGSTIYKTLVYAKVNGNEFGELINAVPDSKIELADFKLFQNYPNPFNPSTTITYAIPEAGFVTLVVFDILGNEVVTLVNEDKAAGRHTANLSLGNRNLSTGVYFYQLKAGSFIATKKMMLLK